MQRDASVLSLTIANDLAEIARLGGFVDDFCARNGIDEASAHAFNLALDELLANIISYGYDDAGPHAIEVGLVADGDRMTAVIRDDARPFDPTAAGEPDIDADLDDRPVGGLGIHIVRTMMDAIVYERIGGHNQLTLTRRVGA